MTDADGRCVRALDTSTWDASDELCANSDGYPSGCYCIGFHGEGPMKQAAALNRNRKLQRVLASTTHAALAFDGDLCVGWCQFGPYVRAGHRRQRVATDALAGVLELIATMGVGRVEGYPEPAGAVPAGFLFHGALSTFDQLGFTRDRMIGKRRWVVSKMIEPD